MASARDTAITDRERVNTGRLLRVTLCARLISPLPSFDYQGREVRLICIGTPVRGVNGQREASFIQGTLKTN